MLADTKELLKIYDDIEHELLKSKKIKEGDVLFSLICDSKSANTITKLLTNNARYLEPEIANKLLFDGLIQKSDPLGKKFSLTFEGISKAITIKYNLSSTNQFGQFLSQVTSKYALYIEEPLDSKEKLTILSLLLLGCYNKDSAIKLDNSINNETLWSSMEEIQEILISENVITSKIKLNIKRGESPESAIIARLYDLPRKLSQMYVNSKKEGVYLDIFSSDNISKQKIDYILEKVFDDNTKNNIKQDSIKKFEMIPLRSAHNILRNEENPNERAKVLAIVENFLKNKFLIS